mgnify:CR=1 FL=1
MTLFWMRAPISKRIFRLALLTLIKFRCLQNLQMGREAWNSEANLSCLIKTFTLTWDAQAYFQTTYPKKFLICKIQANCKLTVSCRVTAREIPQWLRIISNSNRGPARLTLVSSLFLMRLKMTSNPTLPILRCSLELSSVSSTINWKKKTPR